MSSDQTAAAVEPEENKHEHEKSPSFHLLPNSESFHVVKDPLVVHRDKKEHTHEDHAATETAADETKTKEKSPSFHRLPNSESFHVVKDPLKLK